MPRMQRIALVVAVAMVVFSGCLGGAPGSVPPSDLATQDLRCIDAGPQVIDVQAVNDGGQGGLEFSLTEGCALAIEFTLDRVVGNFRLTIDGPGGVVVDVERHGVQEGGAILAMGPRSAEIINEGPAPAGDYVYAWQADAVAHFSIEVEAQRA